MIEIVERHKERGIDYLIATRGNAAAAIEYAREYSRHSWFPVYVFHGNRVIALFTVGKRKK